MFDSTVGRWLQEDPIDIEGGDPNLYRYVGNNPTNATDPIGLQASPTIPGLAGAAAGVAGVLVGAGQGAADFVQRVSSWSAFQLQFPFPGPTTPAGGLPGSRKQVFVHEGGLYRGDLAIRLKAARHFNNPRTDDKSPDSFAIAVFVEFSYTNVERLILARVGPTITLLPDVQRPVDATIRQVEFVGAYQGLFIHNTVLDAFGGKILRPQLPREKVVSYLRSELPKLPWGHPEDRVGKNATRLAGPSLLPEGIAP